MSRRLLFFGIKYSVYDIDVEDVKWVCEKEIDEPGYLLGYRAMQNKSRQVHGVNIPRNMVYDVMTDLIRSSGSQEDRGGVGN